MTFVFNGFVDPWIVDYALSFLENELTYIKNYSTPIVCYPKIQASAACWVQAQVFDVKVSLGTLMLLLYDGHYTIEAECIPNSSAVERLRKCFILISNEKNKDLGIHQLVNDCIEHSVFEIYVTGCRLSHEGQRIQVLVDDFRLVSGEGAALPRKHRPLLSLARHPTMRRILDEIGRARNDASRLRLAEFCRKTTNDSNIV